MRKRRKQGLGESFEPTTSLNKLIPLMSTSICALCQHVFGVIDPLRRMAYIEENLKIRSKPREDSDDEDNARVDPQEALYNIADRWKVEKQKPTTDVGSVTNSLTMLTAIPEVDLGMECVFLLQSYSFAPNIVW